ncbi:uncharacterized protein LOC123529661 [Mercenaria mercenaria]|uniref:uncharacterized protein LOC123529661 n=1 Tax=Mercenaria mercenaria TaxID=6596 RepID=UPI00234EFA6C|nr:uncharacterized protein LOC123529661 [Mercenaria mercenaria]XP_053378085.1 uncharacterized protein LOC123529661 [Mercenaria mercenaria]
MANGYDLNEFTCVNVDKVEDTEINHLERRIHSEKEDWNIPNLPHTKDYHMFISYIQDNAEDVRLIVDNLEREGIKCCYHERDFLPGQQVIGNIHDSINRSMSILVVLSEKFVQSRFCMHEIEQALHASINQNYTIIPIKIEQCDVPEILKNFTYINATSVDAREMHIQIIDAFVWNVWHRDQNVENNGFTLEFPLTKYKIGCRWLSLSRFKLLFDDTSRRKIRRNGFKVSDEHLDDIQKIVSNSVYVKYAHIFNMFGRLTALVFFMLLLLYVAVFITTVEYTFEPTMNKVKTITAARALDYGILTVFLLWLSVMLIHLCGLTGRFRRWKGMTYYLIERSRASLKRAVWKNINSRYAESKKLIIIFRDAKLLIVRYDFKPCQDLFMRRCNINETLKKKMLPTESLRAYVHRIFRNYMQENIEMLSVQSESFGRHTMVNGAKCLCQLVEDSVLLEENSDP